MGCRWSSYREVIAVFNASTPMPPPARPDARTAASALTDRTDPATAPAVRAAAIATPGLDTASDRVPRPVPGRGVALLLALLLLLLPSAATSAHANPVTITGVAFADHDRNGVQGLDEPGFVDHLIYLYDEAGTVIATRRTDAAGAYRFSVPAGRYTVAYAPTAWRALWDELVPTTTGSLEPVHAEVVAPATADFGWRPVVLSTQLSAPISEHRGPEGLRVQSYNDVVSARELYDHLVTRFLVTDEAPHVLVRFGYGTSNANVTTVLRSGGVVTGVSSLV